MARPKRRTIGDNPLDTVIPRTPSRAAATVAELEEGTPKQAKERMTFHLPVEVMQRAKNAVYWTPGLTPADLARRLSGTPHTVWRRNAGKPSLPEGRN
jgi:hypothetical protein